MGVAVYQAALEVTTIGTLKADYDEMCLFTIRKDCSWMLYG